MYRLPKEAPIPKVPPPVVTEKIPTPKIDTPEAMVDKAGKVIATGKSGKLGEISKFNHSFLMTAPDPNLTKFQPGGNTPASILAALNRIQSAKIASLYDFADLSGGGSGSGKGKGGLAGALKSLAKGGPLAKLAKVLSIGKETQKNITEAVSRIENAVKTGMDIAKQASEIYHEVKNDAVGALAKYAGNFGEIGGYIQDGAKIYKVAKDVNWKDLNSVMSASSEIFGKNLLGDFVDVGATVTFVGNLAKKAQELKVPELIDKLKGTISHHDDFRNKLSDGIGLSANASDIRTLSYLTNVVDGSAVTMRYPNFKNMLLSNYQLPQDKKFDEFPHYKEKVTEILDTFDPTWCWEEFNNEMVHSLSPWVKASEDTRKLFMESEFAVDIMIASTYPEQSISSLLRRDYKHYYGTGSVN